jgi:hypothetical protein
MCFSSSLGESKRLLDLLDVGGILVGPFSTASGQYIRRVQRKSATAFEVENLKSVQFGTLVQSDIGAEKIALPCPVWSPETHNMYPKAFQNAVMEMLFSTTREESPTHVVPREIFVDHVFGFLHPRWFDDPSVGARIEVLEGGEREMGNEVTYMAMEGYFHQQVFPNIDKHNQNDSIHVDNFQGRHSCRNKTKTQRERSTTSHRACKVDNFPIIRYDW